MKLFSTSLFILSLLVSFSAIRQASAQDWANLNRYREANAHMQVLQETGIEPGTGAPLKWGHNSPVVFMGNSITENWKKFHPVFFEENGWIGRGISGQTTPQMLLRFRQDVIRLGAGTVVILAGTNDIAGNTGPSTLEMIVDNIAGMCEMARANKIKIVLCSVLPAQKYPWSASIRPDTLIPQLNTLLKAYAEKHNIPYVDFFSALADTNTPGNENGLPARLSPDGVHPNLEGYKIMEEMILKVLPRRSPSSPERTGKAICLMSYNVRNCKGLDNQVDFQRVAEVINDRKPEVAAIQELDSITNRYGSKYALQELAVRTGMHGTYAGAISFGGGQYGIGILSKEKPLSYKIIPLPGREEKRTLLIAEFGTYLFCCTHLSLTPEDRIASLEIIQRELAAFEDGLQKKQRGGKPVFIAGDWNDTPGSNFMQQMQKEFTILTDMPDKTFPANRPNRTLDYIAMLNRSVQEPCLETGNGKKIKTSGELPKNTCVLLSHSVPVVPAASDHRPVCCKVWIY